jgi:hypothetical protein
MTLARTRVIQAKVPALRVRQTNRGRQEVDRTARPPPRCYSAGWEDVFGCLDDLPIEAAVNAHSL